MGYLIGSYREVGPKLGIAETGLYPVFPARGTIKTGERNWVQPKQV